mmetsp:Transcript_27144/g.33537  ORF Transcript_27144/g.33537 Transcript_27144/m.33537 type:complete len:189 (+) Transcript_27144:108-674(+)
MNRNRDRIIGILFLSAFPLYGIGSSLLESASSSTELGLVLVLSNSTVVFLIGRMLQEIVTPLNKVVADAYFYARLSEALILAFSAILVYNHDDDNDVNAWYYRVAMIGLGVGSLPLLTVLTRAEQIPKWLGSLGTVGYSCVIGGIIAGSKGGADQELYMMIPGALFEVTFAIWLIVRGFNFDGYDYVR